MNRSLIVFFGVFFLSSFSSHAVNGWSGAYKVKEIDTLDPSLSNKSYITLESFSDEGCNNNRILLTSSNSDHFKEMTSVILASFHANTNVNIYLSSNCEGIRVRVTK